ncbi:MAG: XRE family transcriptional regulator [Dehalococcoidia bacterium]|nr:MAG: XRE family transcriptional regulator [Dehalococcoidia bacterium]
MVGRKELKQFGANVRLQRSKRGLSQEGLAELAGLHRTYVGAVERGQRNVSFINMVRIAKALGVELGELLNNVA